MYEATDMMSPEFYSNCSTKKRPEKNCYACFGDYCCIPDLKVIFTLNVMEKESKLALAYLSFRKIKRRWINIISMYRRKEADESKKYFVCEHHFKAEEVLVSLRIGRKTLKPGAISKIKPRKSPKKRCLPATNESTSTDSYLEEERETNNSNNLLPITYPETNLDRTKLLEKEADNLKEKINFLVAENNALKAENDTQMTR